MLHLRDLSIMAAVVEEGGIQGAATKLHRTPASISQALRRLENFLSLELFDRTSYRLKLTEQGQAFFNQAQPLLGRAIYLERYATLLSRGYEQSYRISVHPIVPDSAYLPQVCEAASSFKETSLHISVDTAAGPMLRLKSGQADLCIAAVSNYVRGRQHLGTESLVLGTVRILHVISPEILPAYDSPGELIEWLSTIKQIVVSGTVEGDLGEDRAFEEKTSWHVNSPDMKRRLICQGQGWGRLPEPLVRQDLAEGKLISLVVPGFLEPEEMSVWAFRLVDGLVGPVGEAIWQAMAAGRS